MNAEKIRIPQPREKATHNHQKQLVTKRISGGKKECWNQGEDDINDHHQGEGTGACECPKVLSPKKKNRGTGPWEKPGLRAWGKKKLGPRKKSWRVVETRRGF